MSYRIRVISSRRSWIADIEGDPGRTKLKKYAQTFKDLYKAKRHCNYLTEKYTNRKFKIEKI